MVRVTAGPKGPTVCEVRDWDYPNRLRGRRRASHRPVAIPASRAGPAFPDDLLRRAAPRFARSFGRAIHDGPHGRPRAAPRVTSRAERSRASRRRSASATIPGTSMRSSRGSSARNDRARAAFAPVVDARVRVLILGSLPGEASLRAGPVLRAPAERLLAADRRGDRARDRRPALPRRGSRRSRGAGVGLWDVIASAERPRQRRRGDPRRRSTPTSPRLVAGLPALRAVGFNGATAARLGRRRLGGARRAWRSSTCRRRARPTRRCPSPRSARAGRALADLLAPPARSLIARRRRAYTPRAWTARTAGA